MARRDYSPEEKASVLAALLAGQSIDSVAAQYKIPEGTVKAWKNRQIKPILEGVAEVATPKNADEIAELLMELVRAELRSLIAIAEHTSNPKWLYLQGAEQIGVLKGITHDKVFRLMEALERPNARTEPESSQN